jgi:hypothetical protein
MSSELLVPTPLPAVDRLPGLFTVTHKSRYELVLNAEATARSSVELMHARIVGYLMIHLCGTSLASVPLDQLSKELPSVEDERLLDAIQLNERIYALGLHYREKLLRSCERIEL